MKINYANRIAPDWTPRFVASHLGLFCLPMSHKRTPDLYGLTWPFVHIGLYYEFDLQEMFRRHLELQGALGL